MSNKSQISKHLSPEEHVLLRPNMYIGSTSREEFSQFVFSEYKTVEYIPGLLKCVNEIIDNSIDVAIRTDFKFANKIDIEMTAGYVSVEDNGTGMAVIKVEDKDGNKVWNPVLSWTYTNAGSNFTDETEERKTIGMHGLGATAASIFSKLFIGETSDGKKKLKVTTRNNNNLEGAVAGRSTKKYTKVYFEPDFSRFEDINEFNSQHIEIIEDRIHKLAALYPKIKFTFNGEVVSYKSFKDYVEKFDKKYTLYEEDKVSIAYLADDTDENTFISVVNGLNTPNGGRHLDVINSKVSDYLKPMIKRKYKVDVSTVHIKNHTLPIVFMKEFPNFKSDSQTKESVKNTRTEVEAYFKGFDFEKLAKKIMACEDVVMPIVEQHLLKLEQAEKRKLRMEQKKAAKRNIPKHLEPNKRNTGKNILYIVEGDSAKNNFLSSRDKDYHGMYPLRGKMINVRKKSNMEILNNNECKDIMSILNLQIGEEVPEKLPYAKIYITADADVDGYCITAQLINFLKFWPELFERKMVYVVFTPIMEIVKGNTIVKTFYRLSEYRNYTLKSGEKINYVKGLGSMNLKEYKKYLITKPRVELVEDDSDANKYLEIAFDENVDARKEWLSN